MQKRRSLKRNTPPSVVLLDAKPDETLVGHFHIEPLRVRSQRHNWTIPAHVHHGLHQVFSIERGEVTAVIDGETLSVRAPAILLAPSAAPHALRFAQNTAGYVLTIRPLRAFIEPQLVAAEIEAALFSRPHILSYQGASAPWRRLVRLMTLIETEHAPRQHGALDTSRFLLMAALSLMARRAAALNQKSGEGVADHRASFAAFERLADECLVQHLRTGSYAKRLGVSVSTLDRLCRLHAGVSAARYVRDRLFAEARRRLAYSDATIQTIADDMGFADTGYFSRFISRHANLSPSGLRRELRAARRHAEP